MSSFFRPAIVPPIPIYPAFGTQAPYGADEAMLICGFDNRYFTPIARNIPQDILFAYPQFEKEGSIISRFAIRKAGAWPCNSRVGIYKDLGTNRVPGALLADFGTKDTTNTGVNYWTAAPLPYTIPTTGIYWYVMVDDQSLNVIMISPFDAVNSEMLGWKLTGGGNYDKVGGLQSPFVFAALPDPFPLAGIAPIIIGNDNCPALWRSYVKIGV